MNKKLVQSVIADAKAVVAENPGLSLAYKNDYPDKIMGLYVIKDNLGVVQDSFEIEVVIPAAYPFEFPVLKEVGGKIPRISDRHISGEGVACLENPRILDMLKVQGIDLVTFFRTYVHRYFCWQIVYEEDKNDKQLPGWQHSEDGIREFYYEYLGTTDATFIKEALVAIFYNKLPSRNNPCLCNNGKKFKNCHCEKFETIKNRFSRDTIAMDIKLWS